MAANPQAPTPQNTKGLTDNQQAWIVLVSAVLIAVGAVSIPAGLPTWVGLLTSLAGAVGLGLKEALGTKPTQK
jgi:hypothetical protein